MKKVTATIITLFIFKWTLFSQTSEPSKVVEKNILQIELETNYTVQKENSATIKSWSIPNALFRFGLLNGFELQLNIPIIKEQLWENGHLTQSLNKLDNLQVGFSVNLWKEKNLLPEASIMVRAILPTDQKFVQENIGKIVSLNFSNKISENLLLNYNIGHVENTNSSSYHFYIVNMTFLKTSKLHFFIENFGDFHEKKIMFHNLNIGGGYSLGNNLCLNISASKGLTNNTFYFGTILTWLINTKKN